jgi:hypothetical protein
MDALTVPISSTITVTVYVLAGLTLLPLAVIPLHMPIVLPGATLPKQVASRWLNTSHCPWPGSPELTDIHNG